MTRVAIYSLALLAAGCGDSGDGKRKNPFPVGDSVVDVS
jgi:hypothetical protein